MGLMANFLYNLVLTISNYVVGIIVFPYISRVLGVESIGVIGFVDNSINYFILFATLGINTVGVREIARVRSNQEKLNFTYSSLLLLSTILLSIVVIAYLIIVSTVDRFIEFKDLFIIGSGKLIFTVYSIEWFYRGIENFKFICARNILVKIVYIALLFLFVKKEGDVDLYFILTVGSIVVGAAINLFYAKRFVSLSFLAADIRPFIKQVFSIGAYGILTSMYTTFNVMYLGFVSSSVEVGYYWTALKIYTIVLGVYTAFTSVMIPRMSSIVADSRFDRLNDMIVKSFDLLLTLVVPIIVICTVLAPEIIYILAGSGYEGAILPMRLIMPLLLIVGIAQILALQVLVPLRMDNQILRTSIIGAAVGLASNFIFVSRFGSVGTSVVLLISETVITLVYIMFITKSKLIHFPNKMIFKHIIGAIPFLIINLLISQFHSGDFTMAIIAIIVNGVTFICIQSLFLKNVFLGNLVQTLLNRLKQI